MKDKVLYISAFSPFSKVGGGNMRCYNILNILKKKYFVDVVVDFDDVSNCDLTNFKNVNIVHLQSESISLFDRIIHRILLKFHFLPFERLFMNSNLEQISSMRQLIANGNYKYIIVRYLFMIPYYRLYNVKNLVIDIDDLPSQKFKSSSLFQYGKITNKTRRAISRLDKYTKLLADKAIITFLPNANDLRLFRNCFYLPNIPVYDVNKKICRKPIGRIIFVGSMSQDMNFRGVDYFLSNIWPKFILTFSNFQFHIIGKGTPCKYINKWSNIPGVVLRGFVDDLFVEYMAADFSVVPIYNGAGTNIKVLDSLIHKCPTILTSFAHRGFENILITDRDVLVANSDVEFIDCMKYLVNNPSEAIKLAQNGYSSVKNEFNFDKMSHYFNLAINSVES